MRLVTRLAAVVLILIDAGLDGWAAALIVGLLVALIGGGLVMAGRNRLSLRRAAIRLLRCRLA